MVPAGTALAQTAAAPATRLGFIYFPHGALRNEWEPATTGRNPKYPFILEPLEPVRDYVTIVSGLRNKSGRGRRAARHYEETWLNCVHPRQRSVDKGVGVTADQLAARYLQKDAPLPSMEICGEPGGMISFRTPNQPLPMEGNPRKVFISMFGQGQTNEERQTILGTTTSLLDYVTEASASLNRKLDAADRAKVSDYLDSVREVEQRVENLKESSESLANLPDAPIGAPDDFGELLAVQFELFALAWETNRTNVVTMKMVEEASMRVYANLDVHEAFHPTSHWGGFPERIANLRKIQNYHTALFSKFAQRLARTPDGDGSVLDHSIILFGSNIGNSDAHDRPAAGSVDRTRRRPQRQPASALSAQHAARESARHDARSRRRAPREIEVRRQHGPVLRGLGLEANHAGKTIRSAASLAVSAFCSAA
jgi:hypothetical protein